MPCKRNVMKMEDVLCESFSVATYVYPTHLPRTEALQMRRASLLQVV